MLNDELLLESLFFSEGKNLNENFNTFGEYFDSMLESYGDIKDFDSLPFLNESISLNQVKMKKLMKFNEKSMKTKREFLINHGINIDELTKKYAVSRANSLYQSIRKESFNKQGIINVTNKISKEVEQVQKNIITEVSDTLADTFETGSQVGNIASYVAIVTCITIINSLFMALFMIMFGPLLGQILTSVLIAPITEEIGKLTASKMSADTDGGMIYNVIFNVFEFSQYYKMITKMGVDKLTTILIRTPAVIMHTVNQIIIMFGVKKKDKDVNAGSESTVITMCIHAIFNGFLGTVIVNSLLKAFGRSF